MQPRAIAQVIPDRRDWPRIVLDGIAGPVADSLLAFSREREWQLVDVGYYRGTLPLGLVPQGAIVGRLPDNELVRLLTKRRCPTVRIGQLPHPQDRRVPAVIEDLAAVGRAAAGHFAERGFRHVGYIGHIPWSDAKGIYDGLSASASERGIESHLLRFRSAGDDVVVRDRQRRSEFVEWVRSVPKPLGLLTYGDGMGVRLCRWCAEAGVAVPGEVAVLGHGNQGFTCESALITLSSIVPDFEGIAAIAVRTLEALMKGKPVPETTIRVPPLGVVIRESTDVLATRDPVVARALRFMWANLARALSVADIAGEVGVSRRTLERAFRHDLKRGVNREMLRRRIERSCELLRTTETSIADLAPLLGFGSKDYFHRAFRRALGTSPGRYRRGEREKRKEGAKGQGTEAERRM